MQKSTDLEPNTLSEEKSPERPDVAQATGVSMKIGTKIYALVGFCLALLVGVSGVGIWQMSKIGYEIEGIAERDLPLTKALTSVTIHQLEQAINFERAFRLAAVMKTHSAARDDYEKAAQTFKLLSS